MLREEREYVGDAVAAAVMKGIQIYTMVDIMMKTSLTWSVLTFVKKSLNVTNVMMFLQIRLI